MYIVNNSAINNKSLPIFNCKIHESYTPKSKLSAAVGILFIPPQKHQSVAQVVLTERSQEVGSHKGQISFPGGIHDKGDKDLIETVAREIEEEIGVPQSKIVVHGSTKTFKSLHGITVHPLILSANLDNSDFKTNREVASLQIIEWTYLARIHSEIFKFEALGLNKQTHVFQNEGKNIWGLTASILYHCNFEKQ